jgi:hypothetical protein
MAETLITGDDLCPEKIIQNQEPGIGLRAVLVIETEMAGDRVRAAMNLRRILIFHDNP